MLVKLYTPKLDHAGNRIRKQPIFIDPREVSMIRPGDASGGGCQVWYHSTPVYVRESSAVAHKKLFTEPAAEAEKRKAAFAQRHPIALGISEEISDAT